MPVRLCLITVKINLLFLKRTCLQFHIIYRSAGKSLARSTSWCILFNGENISFDASLVIYIEGKAIPLQAWSGPEGSRKLRFPDFVTTAQDGGKVVSLTQRPPLPVGNNLVLISVKGWVDPRAIVRLEGLSLKNSNDTIGNRNRNLPVCSLVP